MKIGIVGLQARGAQRPGKSLRENVGGPGICSSPERFLFTALLLGAASPGQAWAHPGRTLYPGDTWAAWTFDPWVLMALGLAGWLYARGVGRVWRSAGRGRGISTSRFAAFCGGWVALALALISPIHALGGALFFVHMIQHEVLILVAAPLIALGAPLRAYSWGVPVPVSRVLHGVVSRRSLRSVWRVLAHPGGAWALHAGSLWAWHFPVFYEATLTSELAHVAQHAAFLGSALLFWWVLFSLRRHREGLGFGVLMVFTTMLHSNVLGALLTFSPSPWYPSYGETSIRWGYSALEDQQLGGVLMWIPAGTVYLAVALWLLGRWITWGGPTEPALAELSVTTDAPGDPRR